jgi:uncharacterized protein (DUF983 family)
VFFGTFFCLPVVSVLRRGYVCQRSVDFARCHTVQYTYNYVIVGAFVVRSAMCWQFQVFRTVWQVTFVLDASAYVPVCGWNPYINFSFAIQ